MPAEIVSEVFGGIFRIISRIFIEVILEILIKGAGFLICKPFNSDVEPDGFFVLIIGLLFWVLLISIGISAYDFFVIDSCLDSGGKYDYDSSECVH